MAACPMTKQQHVLRIVPSSLLTAAVSVPTDGDPSDGTHPHDSKPCSPSPVSPNWFLVGTASPMSFFFFCLSIACTPFKVHISAFRFLFYLSNPASCVSDRHGRMVRNRCAPSSVGEGVPAYAYTAPGLYLLVLGMLCYCITTCACTP